MPQATPLQREIRQTRPFQSPGHEAVVGLLRTADVVRRLFNDLFEPAGITLQQYNVLRILRGAGPQALPTLAIRDRMVERTPGITRLIDRLVAKKLVQRVTSKQDRRQVLCRITPKGLDLLKRLDQPVARLDKHAVSALAAKDVRRLIDLLDAVRAKHESKEPAP